MKESDVSTPLIEKYTEILESNPKSRVFAPLAESYRKLGMVKQALKILQQGIRYNPDYVLGHLGIAHCYSDSGEYVLAYNTLKPLIVGNRDNILLQRLFSDICLKIGHKEEALETFKFLLFINARDEYAAKMVKELEDNIFPSPGGRPEFVISEQPAEEELFNVKNIKTASDIDEFDEWVEVKLSTDEIISPKNEVKNNFDDWSVQKEVKEDLSVETSQDDDEFIFENEIEQQVPFAKAPSMFTQTLVNLYCSQGHYAKAREILEKILELNPNDNKAKDKIIEIDQLMAPEQLVIPAPKKSSIVNENEDEDTGRKNLMNFFDTKIRDFEEDEIIEDIAPEVFGIQDLEVHENEDTSLVEIEERLWAFHSLLKQRAEQSLMHL